MKNEEIRYLTEHNMRVEMNNLVSNYMKIYDEYYLKGNDESYILKELTDAIIGISSCLEVYARDGEIYPNYALEKLNNTKRIVDFCIEYYEKKPND